MRTAAAGDERGPGSTPTPTPAPMPAPIPGRQKAPLEARPRVVVLRHHQRVPLGALAAPLEEQAELILVEGFRGEPGATGTPTSDLVDRLIHSGGYDAVIALGGPMGVYEVVEHAHLGDSLRLLGDALQRDLPILGLCLGSQLLAEAAGATVFPGNERALPPEVGFYPVGLTPDGRRDPVMQIYAGKEPLLFWHRDTHDLPPGGRLLAATRNYPVSAYRLRTRAYGLQFHLETLPEQLEVWVEQSPLVAEAGIDPQAVLTEARRREPQIRERARRLVELFLRWAAAAQEERWARTNESASSTEEA